MLTRVQERSERRSGGATRVYTARPGKNVGRHEALVLALAGHGDTILISGTCHERVTVAVDRIALDGQRSAVIDGGGGGPAEYHNLTITSMDS